MYRYYTSRLINLLLSNEKLTVIQWRIIAIKFRVLQVMFLSTNIIVNNIKWKALLTVAIHNVSVLLINFSGPYIIVLLWLQYYCR